MAGPASMVRMPQMHFGRGLTYPTIDGGVAGPMLSVLGQPSPVMPSDMLLGGGYGATVPVNVTSVHGKWANAEQHVVMTLNKWSDSSEKTVKRGTLLWSALSGEAITKGPDARRGGIHSLAGLSTLNYILEEGALQRFLLATLPPGSEAYRDAKYKEQSRDRYWATTQAEYDNKWRLAAAAVNDGLDIDDPVTGTYRAFTAAVGGEAQDVPNIWGMPRVNDEVGFRLVEVRNKYPAFYNPFGMKIGPATTIPFLQLLPCIGDGGGPWHCTDPEGEHPDTTRDLDYFQTRSLTSADFEFVKFGDDGVRQVLTRDRLSADEAERASPALTQGVRYQILQSGHYYPVGIVTAVTGRSYSADLARMTRSNVEYDRQPRLVLQLRKGRLGL